MHCGVCGWPALLAEVAGQSDAITGTSTTTEVKIVFIVLLCSILDYVEKWYM